MDGNGKAIAISGTQRKRLQCPADTAAAHAKPSFVLGWVPTLPSLSSVLSLTDPVVTDLQGPAVPSQGPRGQILSNRGMRSVRLLDAGLAVVREIRPDGRVRELFRCQAPCEREYRPLSEGIAWIEILQSGGRTLLSTGTSR